jgi:hypothetical protein
VPRFHGFAHNAQRLLTCFIGESSRELSKFRAKNAPASTPDKNTASF